MGKNIVQKIIGDHLVSGDMVPGEGIACQPDPLKPAYTERDIPMLKAGGALAVA